MKIPVIGKAFNPATNQEEPRRTDLANELKDVVVSALSFVTQCETGVEFGKPELLRSVAGMDHYQIHGEFSSGDAFGELMFRWTARHDSPAFYDVNTCAVKFGSLGWAEAAYHGPAGFVDRITQDYRMFLETLKFLPRRFPEIEDILDSIRAVDVPPGQKQEIKSLADQISALIGNAPREEEK